MSSSAEPRLSSRSRAFVSIPDMNRYYVDSDRSVNQRDSGPTSDVRPIGFEKGLPSAGPVRDSNSVVREAAPARCRYPRPIWQVFAAHRRKRTIHPLVSLDTAREQLSPLYDDLTRRPSRTV